MGVGVETSSHKFGLFQHNCVSFEIVTADGSLLRCSKPGHVDLGKTPPALWPSGKDTRSEIERYGFDPRPSQTKDLKIGIRS
ncbi:delta(24)-sterol reductase-like [Elysia marginata]|uniref:Delta(24)-sterol reductase-like n=1 Tax=Elysia marginata TaxID=1093978 RepID=A0AAV4GA72_9GAST|nr:delta(24)-sterol reductase-like [Elysia marginata]